VTQAELFRLHPEYRHPPSGPRPKPPPARLKLTPCVPPEGYILDSILKALPFFKRVSWFQRMNNGAYAVGVGKDRRFIRYGFKGCSDIIGQLVDGGRFLAIEVKKPGEHPNDDQKAFLGIVNANGGLGFVARNIDDLREHLA
jgi:hypothetical protein